MAEKRILNELKSLRKNPPSSCRAGPVSENIFHWEGIIFGPEDSPYAGGVFLVNLYFPPDYPQKPTKVSFKTKVFHPNISSINGSIRLHRLMERWILGDTISKVLLDIRSLLKDPKPEESHPYEPEILHMYKINRQSMSKLLGCGLSCMRSLRWFNVYLNRMLVTL